MRAPPFPRPAAGADRIGPSGRKDRPSAIWRRTLTVGEPLPVMPLPLTTRAALDIDLEKTYMLAAADAYL